MKYGESIEGVELPKKKLINSAWAITNHHAILQPSSSTTKLLTVFDNRVRVCHWTTLCWSALLTRLRSSILLFHLENRADISKIYRMILVHTDHTQYQRVFWRADSEKPLKTLEILIVTYKTASAPHLATRRPKHLAHDEGHVRPPSRSWKTGKRLQHRWRTFRRWYLYRNWCWSVLELELRGGYRSH